MSKTEISYQLLKSDLLSIFNFLLLSPFCFFQSLAEILNYEAAAIRIQFQVVNVFSAIDTTQASFSVTGAILMSFGPSGVAL